MKGLLLIMMGLLVLSACGSGTQREAGELSEAAPVAADTTEFPILIENGSKIVFQIGRMTPDKGLKVYLDTIAYDEKVWSRRDSLRELLTVKDE